MPAGRHPCTGCLRPADPLSGHQRLWQAAGLALFYYWGSSQSRESDERIEAKLDALLRQRNLDPENP